MINWTKEYLVNNWVWLIVYGFLIVGNALTFKAAWWVIIPLAWFAASWSDRRYEKYSDKPLTSEH